MVYTQYFQVCSNLRQFDTEITFLEGIFCKNGYPGKFIAKCIKSFLNNINLAKENVPKVEKSICFQ